MTFECYFWFSSSKDFLHSITDPGTHVPTYFCNYAKKGSGIVLSRHREFHPFFFSCSRIWAVKVQGDFINMQNFQAGDLFIAYREENSGKHNQNPSTMTITKDAGIFTPLLPELNTNNQDEDSGGGASVPGAVFNVSTSTIGAGIMSIPATLKVLGVIPAIILIVVIAILSEVSAEFLIRFTKSSDNLKKTTYAGVMGESFGRVGSIMLQICIMITNLGCLIIYLIIIGDVLCGSGSNESVHSGMLQEWFGLQWWNTRSFAILFTVIFVMLPLVLLKRVESLRFTSAVSVLLAVVFVAISTVLAISALWHGKTMTPRMLPVLENKESFFELFTAVPIIVSAFTFHFNVHPIAAELRKTSEMVTAVRISLVLCAAVYAAVGFFGYLLFGDSTMPDILSNFDHNFGSNVGTFLNDTVRLSYALHLMLVFPLPNFSLRVNVDEFLFPEWPLLSSHNIRFVPLTCILLIFVYIAAIAIPNIWFFFQFLGSTTSLCVAFIFPGAIVLRDVQGVATRRDKILAVLMIAIAVIASTIAIYSNIASLLRT
ncbi:amino acid transporter AVT6C-like isoform X2 [Papaver somniferum]|nr:amino acid transporter AVT6C-like isoform X2 [Papaver somniferum]